MATLKHVKYAKNWMRYAEKKLQWVSLCIFLLRYQNLLNIFEGYVVVLIHQNYLINKNKILFCKEGPKFWKCLHQVSRITTIQ